MKFASVFSGLMIAAMMLLVGAASAATVSTASATKPSGCESRCNITYQWCLSSGTSQSICAQKLYSCRLGCTGFAAVQAPADHVDAAALTVADLVAMGERHSGGLLVLASAGAAEPTSTAWGSTYCRKLLYRCDNGDASACTLFMRNCGG